MDVRRRISRQGLLVAGAVLAFAALAFAHGTEQHVMGTVIKIDAGSIAVKTTRGDTITVMVLASTKFVKGASAVTEQDLKIGDRVVIHAKPEGNTLHATEVKIGGASGGP